MNIFVFIELVEIKTYEADEQPERNNIFFFLYYKKRNKQKGDLPKWEKQSLDLAHLTFPFTSLTGMAAQMLITVHRMSCQNT